MTTTGSTDNSSLSTAVENSSNVTNCRWCLNERLVGPAIAAVVSVELVLSLLANSFICVQTLRGGLKTLKKSSTILLFNLALGNLLMATLYLPFVIISSAAGQWIVTGTDPVREGICEFSGFVFAYATSLSVHTLAAVSFDRFLSIVRPQAHRRFMTWKTALVIVVGIWVSV